jgi:protein required for attachment to host cells
MLGQFPEGQMHTGSTLVLVADGAIARFLSRARPGVRLVELVDLGMAIEPFEAERDRPPRVQDSRGGRRHKIERRQTAHEVAETRFLADAAKRAASLLGQGGFTSFVVCAPPKALGILRDSLPAEAREHLVQSLDKDITKETPAEIDRRLSDLRA